MNLSKRMGPCPFSISEASTSAMGGGAICDSAFGRVSVNLIHIDTQSENITYPIKKLNFTLGREADLIFPHDDLAKQHAKITYSFEDGVFECLVLGKNGLKVNDDFVSKNQRILLEKSNNISVGSFTGMIKFFQTRSSLN